MRIKTTKCVDIKFRWLRIQYYGDRKVYNFWGFERTHARKVK